MNRILSSVTAIGLHYDKFVQTPRRALEWKHRRFYILQEMLTYMPDVFCLQVNE